MEFLKVCLFGAGRIGTIHAGNIAANRFAELTSVVDVNEEAARQLTDQVGGHRRVYK